MINSLSYYFRDNFKQNAKMQAVCSRLILCLTQKCHPLSTHTNSCFTKYLEEQLKRFLMIKITLCLKELT